MWIMAVFITCHILSMLAENTLPLLDLERYIEICLSLVKVNRRPRALISTLNYTFKVFRDAEICSSEI